MPAGPLDVIRQRNLIAASADGRVREEGFKNAMRDSPVNAISWLSP